MLQTPFYRTQMLSEAEGKRYGHSLLGYTHKGFFTEGERLKRLKGKKTPNLKQVDDSSSS